MPKQRRYATSADGFPIAAGMTATLVWPELKPDAARRRSAPVKITFVCGPAKVRVRFKSGVEISYPPEMIFLIPTQAIAEINR